MTRMRLAEKILEEGSVVLTQQQKAVVDSACQLFDQRGYHQTSMAHIADAVGRSKPTLYHHFASKAEILFCIHHEIIEWLLERQESRGRDMAAADRLKLVIGDLIEVIAEMGPYFRVFHDHRRELPEELQAHVRLRRAESRVRVERIIEDGINEGAFGPLDPRLAALSVLGMANSARHWLGGPIVDAEPDVVASVMQELILSGMTRTDVGDERGIATAIPY